MAASGFKLRGGARGCRHVGPAPARPARAALGLSGTLDVGLRPRQVARQSSRARHAQLADAGSRPAAGRREAARASSGPRPWPCRRIARVERRCSAAMACACGVDVGPGISDPCSRHGPATHGRAAAARRHQQLGEARGHVVVLAVLRRVSPSRLSCPYSAAAALFEEARPRSPGSASAPCPCGRPRPPRAPRRPSGLAGALVAASPFTTYAGLHT